MSSLEAVVRALRRSDARSSAVRYLLHAALASAGWFFVVIVAARLVPVEQVWRIAAFGVPVVFGAVAVAWAAARPRPMRLMRAADLRLGLKERLSTAWERRLGDGPLDAASPAPVDPQVQKILQDTQAKIANAPDPRAALQNITPAEQQLLQLSDPQTPARTSSAQNLANSLGSTAAGRVAGQAINASPA